MWQQKPDVVGVYIKVEYYPRTLVEKLKRRNTSVVILIVKNPTRCNSVSKTLLFLVLNEAQHVSGDTAHHQESKTAQAASGFAYVEGCRTFSCWTLSGSVRYLPRM
jgi:hypothetical protein